MKLEVSKKRKPVPRSTEAAFEKRVAKVLEGVGLMSYHTAERFYKGIPDRYVAGGNWIEFKAVPYSGTRRITPTRFFKPEQKLWLTRFHNAGDRVFVCILFQPENGEPRVLLCPWALLEGEGSMSTERVDRYSMICSTTDDLKKFVALRFGHEHDRFSNYKMSFLP